MWEDYVDANFHPSSLQDSDLETLQIVTHEDGEEPVCLPPSSLGCKTDS
jgi:hypothetical protein